MTKKCGNCGSTPIDEMYNFCNKCGARLQEQIALTCNKCGKINYDGESQFCNYCGSPLVPVLRTSSPVKPAAKGKNCAACGFENFGENRFYCKKCGAYILKNEPIEREQKQLREDTAFKPNSQNINRLNESSEVPDNQELSPRTMKSRPKKHELWSFRKFAAIGTGIIFVFIILGIFVVFIPGILPINYVNSTVADRVSLSDEAIAGTVEANQVFSEITTSTNTSLTEPSAIINAIITVTPLITNSPAVGSQNNNNITNPWSLGVDNNSTNPWSLGVDNNSTNPWSLGVGYNSTNPWSL